ncbi:molybdopterin dehydrogenase [Intrasporangium chromatireducens Q5-1]|uniref:Molybdopterin dehydrogenase n=1 Tax=Intrasporangium chromatireducens Q5-1 TaxID=584657 RepID=W9GNM8_9MICO|nr:FAD binding domain-containing protein [Intrasporangium chromatireducens]EWT06677.1 molybdopterin dehydrogenase [Intrasporangium chromatireducens Q5-1]
MKPAAFDYVRPRSVDEVLVELAADPDETKVLAGGQSLVPMMNFRLARPSRLVDINDAPGLDGVERVDGHLVIRTRTRHLTVQNLPGADPLTRLLRSAAHQVGHLPIRTRGTFGGSLAHCDAASEWCLVATLLDAQIVVTSAARGERTIPARDFFQSIFTTAMEPDELLLSVSLPVLDDTHTAGIAEFARRAGDFAIVAVTTDVAVTDGTVTSARVCIGGVSDIPFRSAAAEAVLTGAAWPEHDAGGSALVQAAAEAAADEVDPPTDSHGTGDYRRDLVRALLPRAISQGGGR